MVTAAGFGERGVGEAFSLAAGWTGSLSLQVVTAAGFGERAELQPGSWLDGVLVAVGDEWG